MNNLDNTVTLDGFAKGEFEKRQAGKTDVTQFQVATNSYRKNKKTGEYDQYTEWHTCEAWGPTAKYIADRLQKGSAVKLSGKLEYSTYKKDYTKGKTTVEVTHTRAIIRVNEIRITNKKASSED